VLAQGVVRRMGAVAHGALDVAAGFEVHRQLAGHRGRMGPVRALEPAADAEVQAHAPTDRDALVEDLPVERVDEPIASGDRQMTSDLRRVPEKTSTRSKPCGTQLEPQT